MSLGLFAAAVAVRLVALAVSGIAPQTFEYEFQARSLLAGDGYQLVHLRTPHRAFGFPVFGFLCAGLYWTFGPRPLPVLLVQIGLSSLIPVVIARVAGAIGLGRRTAALAGAIAVVHPALVVYAVRKLHPLSMDALLISLSLLLIIRLPGAGSWTHVGTGAMVGLTALTRPTMGLFVLPAAAWAVWAAAKGTRTRALAGAALLAVGAVAVVSPWTVRNFLVLGRFVPITTSSAEVFWIGNNPVATGSTYLLNGRAVFSGAPEAFQREILARDELRQVDLFRETARDFVREHPAAFVQRLVGKWWSFWWFPAGAGTGYPHWWLLAYKSLYGVASIGVLLGLRVAWTGAEGPERLRLVLVLALLAHVSVAQSFFYVDARHRWAVEPLLGIFLAAGVGRWLPAADSRTRASS